MAHIAQDSRATIYFTFTWKSTHASHIERYLADNVSFTRDILPLGIKSRMRGLGVGDSVELTMDPSEVPPFKPGKVLDMPVARFQPPLINGRTIKPRIGRYYPKNYIENVPGTRPDSDTPFRVVETDKTGFKADLNHPMAGREVSIRATVIDIIDTPDEAGALNRWPDIILKGPGMQARLPETPTDYLGAEPFKRRDEAGDADFYAKPPMSSLLDEQAETNVQKLYGEVLDNDMDILDLMAGHVSHLPADISPKSVTGLGLSQVEMDANPALSRTVVHNINEDPALPFEDNTFDAVVCTASVGYLIKPFEVFEDVARVLKPGGVFILTFSNRWFEEKVIRVWTELQEFERMGLVSQYLIRSEMYENITTSSERGWPAPDGAEAAESDPVYAVWATKL